MGNIFAGTQWEDKFDVKDPYEYVVTPKNRDPYSAAHQGVNTRVARMYLPDGLITYLKSNAAKNTVDSIFSGTENILNHFSAEKPYINFNVENVSESFEDKFQITETLGDSYVVFGIGKKPRIFNFQGSLINSEEHEWRVKLIYLFEKYISVSRLARFKSEKYSNFVSLAYDTVVLEGALLNLRTGISAPNELISPFSFTMIVPKITARVTAMSEQRRLAYQASTKATATVANVTPNKPEPTKESGYSPSDAALTDPSGVETADSESLIKS